MKLKNNEQDRQIIDIDEFYDLIEYEDVDEEYIEAVNSFFGRIVDGMEEEELEENFLYLENLKAFYLDGNEKINYLENNYKKIKNKLKNIKEIINNKKAFVFRIRAIKKYVELLELNKDIMKNKKIDIYEIEDKIKQNDHIYQKYSKVVDEELNKIKKFL